MASITELKNEASKMNINKVVGIKFVSTFLSYTVQDLFSFGFFLMKVVHFDFVLCSAIMYFSTSL